MSFSTSSPKRAARDSSKLPEVRPFDLFHQLTFMSAMASAGIARGKTFEVAAQASSPVAQYFTAINNLVDQFRYDYPEACRIVGEKATNDDVRSFLLRLSDALRSGEPLDAYLNREAVVQAENYGNHYERDVESMKQWSDAFSSMIVSVSMIVIIQLVSALIYSMDMGTMSALIAIAIAMGFFGAWIISRAAPQEDMALPPNRGSVEQARTLRLFRILAPLAVIVCVLMIAFGAARGYVLLASSALLLPVGISGFLSDLKVNKRDEEYSTFLRSAGGMATSTGSTLKESLNKIDLSSFPTLRPEIDRLSQRLQSMAEPSVCWKRFGRETGSTLISQATDIFYSAIRLGGDPERVGYLCSMFALRTSQLRARRRLASGTFSGLTLVMQGVVSGLMVFVMEIVNNFVLMMDNIVTAEQSDLASEAISLGLPSFSGGELVFLQTITITMIILLGFIATLAIVASDGGDKLKGAFYLSIAMLISGVAFIVLPPVVASILQV